MKIISELIPIPSNCTYTMKKNGIKLYFDQGIELDLFWQNFVVEVKESSMVVSYVKKWTSLANPIIVTWKNLIKKYEKKPLYHYIIKPIFKHFPIILGFNGHTISVFNYLGLKKTFYVKMRNIKTIELKQKEIHITTSNDILTGSDLNMLKAIRYKTHHKNLDRRIFTDGFLIEKKCLI